MIYFTWKLLNFQEIVQTASDLASTVTRRLPYFMKWPSYLEPEIVLLVLWTALGR